MPNSATQNPANKVGRNSGAGAGGVSEVVPTEAEARRGLTSNFPTTGGSGGSGVGSLARLGVVGAVGAGLAALITRHLRRPKSRLDRLRDYVGLGK
jgi:hypothetical protein